MPARLAPPQQPPANSLRYEERSASDSSNLPQQVLSTVPSCAQSCLLTYVSQTFSSCAADDYKCLCTNYSSQDYTLGELAYVCIPLDCQGVSDAGNTKAATAAYNVCVGQSGAVAARHTSIISPPPTSTISTASSTGTSVVGSAATFWSQSSATLTTMPSSSAGAATSTGTASVQTPAESTSTATPGVHTLTGGQAVGISLGAMGGLFLLLGFLWCCCCVRRRKKDDKKKSKAKHGSYDFIDAEPRQKWRTKSGSSILQSSFARATSERRASAWSGARSREIQQARRESTAAAAASAAAAAAAVSTTIHVHSERERAISPESRRSHESTRTISQLLPEKPDILQTYAPLQARTVVMPPPQAHVPARSPKYITIATPATVFEEDRTTFVPGLPANPAVGYRPYKKPSQNLDPSTAASGPDRRAPPLLSLNIPKQASKPVAKPTAPAWSLPSNPSRPPLAVLPVTQQATNSDSATMPKPSPSRNSILDYYTGNHDSPLLHDMRSIKSIKETKRSQGTNTPPEKANASSSRKAVRQSSASDTSFESAGEDELTPPEEAEKQLTPVAEKSPIADIRYPKIPRSTNQRVPRSPQYMMGTYQRSPEPKTTQLSSPPLWASELRSDPPTPRRQMEQHRALSLSNHARAYEQHRAWSKDLPSSVTMQTFNKPAHDQGQGQGRGMAGAPVQTGQDLYFSVMVGSPTQSRFPAESHV